MGCGCKAVDKVINGAVGIAKSVTGVGVATEAEVEGRRVICRQCEHAIPCNNNNGKKCVCAKCGCRLKHKTRVASESCPLGKWVAITVNGQ